MGFTARSIPGERAAADWWIYESQRKSKMSEWGLESLVFTYHPDLQPKRLQHLRDVAMISHNGVETSNLEKKKSRVLLSTGILYKSQIQGQVESKCEVLWHYCQHGVCFVFLSLTLGSKRYFNNKINYFNLFFARSTCANRMNQKEIKIRVM